MHKYLDMMIAHKRNELKHHVSSAQRRTIPKKSLKQALSQPKANVIAEIKRRSPSRGRLADIPDPAALAQQYVLGGASAISVLTDTRFDGTLDDLTRVALALKETPVPILQKDFILEREQIDDALVLGADAILLIITVLKEKTAALFAHAKKCGLDVLVEAHDAEEIAYACEIGADIIGINNRDLHTFTIDPDRSLTLKPLLPHTCISVAESGIRSPQEAIPYLRAGYHALLIGEALVTAKNPGIFIQHIEALSCHINRA